jgi:poly(3-hydroxyalkanoate) synthetase
MNTKSDFLWQDFFAPPYAHDFNMSHLEKMHAAGTDWRKRDLDGQGALVYFVSFNNIEGVRFLFKNGFSPNQLDYVGLEEEESKKEKHTLIEHAVSTARLEMVKFLIQEGADVLLRNSLGNTALVAACVEMEVEDGKGVSAEIFETLLDEIPDLNVLGEEKEQIHRRLKNIANHEILNKEMSEKGWAAIDRFQAMYDHIELQKEVTSVPKLRKGGRL